MMNLADKPTGKRGCRPLRSSAGFTLVEMLAALIVVVLLTGVVATGVSAGMTMYKQTTFTSESEALSSTIDSALSGSLRYAQRTSDGSAYTITYRSTPISSLSPESIVTTSGGKLYWGMGTDHPLLNDSAYTDCIVSSITVAPKASDGETVFDVTYTITSKTDSSKTKTFGTADYPIEYRMSSLATKAS